MKPIKVICMVSMLYLIVQTTSAAAGPESYNGTVLDETTGMPIEGASVLFLWRTNAPREATLKDPGDAQFTSTGSSGKYRFSIENPSTDGPGSRDFIDMIIYEPGYKTSITSTYYDTTPVTSNGKIKIGESLFRLERVQPGFDHDAHFHRIKEGIEELERNGGYYGTDNAWQDLSTNGYKTLLQGDRLLRRAEWEDRRKSMAIHIGLSGDKIKKRDLLLHLLKDGHAQEKQLVLRNLQFLQFEEFGKDHTLLDLIFTAQKDRDEVVREAAVALWGQVGKRSNRDIFQADIAASLVAALQDKSSVVRAEAARSLRYYADQQTVDALVKCLRDQDRWVRLNSVQTLGELGSMKVVVGMGGKPALAAGVAMMPPHGDKKSIQRNMQQRNTKNSRGNIEALPKNGMTISGLDIGPVAITTRTRVAKSPHLNVSSAIAPMIDILGREPKKDDDWREVFVQQAVVAAFQKMHVQDERAISLLVRRIDQDYLKIPIIKALGSLEVLDAENILLKSLEDKDAEVRQAAVDALILLPIKRDERKMDDILLALNDALQKSNPEMRQYATKILGRTADGKNDAFIDRALCDENDEVVRSAIQALEKQSNVAYLAKMIPLFEHRNKQLRESAVSTFQQIAERAVPEYVHSTRPGSKMTVVTKRFLGQPLGTNRVQLPAASGLLLDELSKGNTIGKMSVMSILAKYVDEKIEPQLISLLEDSSQEVRDRALELLGAFGTKRSVPALIKIVQSSDKVRKRSALNALTNIEDKRTIRPLLALLKDDNINIRNETFHALKKYNDPAVVKAAMQVIQNDRSDYVRSAAIDLMKERRDPRAAPLMLAELNKYGISSKISLPAFGYLGEIGDKRAVSLILAILENEMKKGCGVDDHYKTAPVVALGKLRDERAVTALIGLLACNNSSMTIKEETVRAMGSIKSRKAVPALRAALKDDLLASLAISVLGEIGDPQALDDITKKLYQAERFRPDAIKAIIRINDERSAYILAEFMIQSSRSREDELIFAYFQKLERSKSIMLFLKISGKLERLDDRVNRITEILKKTSKKEVIKELSQKMKNEDTEIRRGAAVLLGELRYKECIAPLKGFLKDSDPGIRRTAQDSLELIETPASRKIALPANKKSGSGSAVVNADISRDAIVWSQPLTLRAAPWTVQPMAISGEHIFLGGSIFTRNTGWFDLNFNWLLEKRNLSDGSLVAEFNTQGVYAGDAVGRISGIVADTEHIYLLGEDKSLDKSSSLLMSERIEKRHSMDGSLVPEFGNGGALKIGPIPYAAKNADPMIALYGDHIFTTGSGRIKKLLKKNGQLVSEFGDKGILTIDAGRIIALAFDAKYLFIAEQDFIGMGDTRWRIEKRSLDNGSLVMSFGIDGIVTANPSPGDDKIHALTFNGGCLYVAGYASASGKNMAWRIEKRNAIGSLVTSFGRGGVITDDPSTGSDWVMSMIFSSPSKEHLYIVGRHAVPGEKDERWRIEMRRTTDGSLVSTFGKRGVMTYAPGRGRAGALGIVESGPSLYVGGVGGEQAQLLNIRK